MTHLVSRGEFVCTCSSCFCSTSSLFAASKLHLLTLLARCRHLGIHLVKLIYETHPHLHRTRSACALDQISSWYELCVQLSSWYELCVQPMNDSLLTTFPLQVVDDIGDWCRSSIAFDTETQPTHRIPTHRRGHHCPSTACARLLQRSSTCIQNTAALLSRANQVRCVF